MTGLSLQTFPALSRDLLLQTETLRRQRPPIKSGVVVIR